MLQGLIAVIIGYLLGSIPAAYTMAKLRKGIDIREVGVGNMGAGNVIREIGLVEGLVVGGVDIGKGAATIFIAQALGAPPLWVLAAGFAAVLGHSFPVYIGFRGGQGASTAIGIFCVLTPLSTLIVLLPLGALMGATRQIFASTLIIGPLLPLVVWLVSGEGMLVAYALFMVLFLLFRSRHRFREVQQIMGRTTQ
jgi:glycerol-3-phosphate acyltransferase PlsY